MYLVGATAKMFHLLCLLRALREESVRWISAASGKKCLLWVREKVRHLTRYIFY
jgi:hypothetical protein